MKKVISILLAMIMLMFAVGCTGQEAPVSTGSETSTQGGTSETNTVSTVGTPIVIYTNSGSDNRDIWLTERAAKAGFNITVVNGAIVSRLVAEKNSPIADVCWGLNSFSYEILKAQKVLEAYTPVWADQVSEGLNDSEGYYHATALQAVLLCYDSNQLPTSQAPTDWIDLWTDPAYAGKYEFATDTGTGTFRCFLAGILSRYADENGYLGVSDEGWKQVDMYYENGVSASSGTDLYAKIADPSSSVVMGQIWSSGVEARDVQYGTVTEYVVPEVGVPFAVEALALVRGSKNAEEAKRFIDWFGSSEIQAEYAQEFSTIPANELAVSSANEFSQKIAQLKRQDIDWVWVAEHIDDWCEEIELMYK